MLERTWFLFAVLALFFMVCGICTFEPPATMKDSSDTDSNINSSMERIAGPEKLCVTGSQVRIREFCHILTVAFLL